MNLGESSDKGIFSRKTLTLEFGTHLVILKPQVLRNENSDTETLIKLSSSEKNLKIHPYKNY